MQVILQKSVVNLGQVGDVVTVKSGFARNYLLPKELAVPVTVENKKMLDEQRATLEKEASELLTVLQAQAKAMANVKLTLSVQANETGQLFGSVSMNEVQALLTEAGHTVEKKALHIAQGNIRMLGEYQLIVQLHPDVRFELPLTLIAAQTDQAVVEQHEALHAELSDETVLDTSVEEDAEQA